MKTIHKQLIVAGVLLVVLILVFGGAKNSSKSLVGGGDKVSETGGNTNSGTKPTTNYVSTGSKLLKTENKEFPFSFTEKNLVYGTKFGEFLYGGTDYANIHKFTGNVVISGQVALVKSDGSHSIGLLVDKKDINKLPQYYFESIKGENDIYNYTRSTAPYALCFGYYHPAQYDFNHLVEQLSNKPGERVTVEIGNYKILATKDHVGACANLYKIIEPRF